MKVALLRTAGSLVTGVSRRALWSDSTEEENVVTLPMRSGLFVIAKSKKASSRVGGVSNVVRQDPTSS